MNKSDKTITIALLGLAILVPVLAPIAVVWLVIVLVAEARRIQKAYKRIAEVRAGMDDVELRMFDKALRERGL